MATEYAHEQFAEMLRKAANEIEDDPSTFVRADYAPGLNGDASELIIEWVEFDE